MTSLSSSIKELRTKECWIFDKSAIRLAKVNYFIIPGNPPALHFYELWKNDILAKNPTAQVQISEYPKLDHNRDSGEVMQNILSTHAERLLAFQHANRGPLTLIGHSLGGHFALKLLNQHSDAIYRTVLIHPFLRTPSNRGKKIIQGLSLLHGRTLCQNLILRSRKFLERFNDDLAMVTNEQILTCLNLTFHEHNTIAQDQTHLVIDEALRSKLNVFYVPGDIWCSPNVISALEPQVRTIECTEPHDFVTSTDHRASLLEKIQNLGL